MKIQSYNKYGNKKTVVDGFVFASRKEANRYGELRLLERAGEIKELRCQWAFKLYAGIKYVADFAYWEPKNPEKMVVEDVKSSLTFKTEVYKIKKKLLLDKYHDIDFREIY